MTTRLKEIISKIADIEPKIGKALRAERVMKLWERAVDKRILKQTEPEGIKGSTLYVLTSSSAWANELTLLRTKFLQKINTLAEGEGIKDIRFRVGNISGEEREERGKNTKQYRKCKTCGAEHARKSKLCPVCYIYLQDKKTVELQKRLHAEPNVEYQTIKKERPELGKVEFEKAKERIKFISLDRIALVAREAMRTKKAHILDLLYDVIKNHIKFFGGQRESILKKALGVKTYKEFSERNKKKKTRRGGKSA